MSVQLARPLDFLVVADHAYNMGVVPNLHNANTILLETEPGRRLLSDFQRYQDTNDHSIYQAIKGTLIAKKYLAKKGHIRYGWM